MDGEAALQTSGPNSDVCMVEPELQLTNIDSVEVTLSGGDMAQEAGVAGEILTEIELDLACSSEKLANLDILMMHVAMRENDLEVFLSDREHISSDSAEKAMEFDLLSGIWDSEVRELDNFMSTVQNEIVNAHEVVSSCKHLGHAFEEMVDKLHCCEESLRQLLDRVSEIMAQSAKFQRILSTSGKSDNGVDLSGGGVLMDQSAKIKLHTAEQKRHVLRMLENSLARELDFEEKICKSRQIEEELKLRLHSLEQEVFFMEEEAGDVWERLFEAENTAQALMGISKEILGRLQIAQFNLNGSVQREENLRSEFQNSMEKLKAKDIALQKLEKQLEEKEVEMLNAKSSKDEIEVLHSQICEMETAIKDLKEKISRAESRAETADNKCKVLSETNMKLNEDLRLLKSSGAFEKVNSLERQLRESDIQLQHALASAEASQEKQNMLYSTIHDMENLIEDLKFRVSKAESRAESAEDKCIILSESNSNLNEELSFLRSRLEFLEASLHRADETKMATVKDIGIRTKVITNLVVQLAFERERLQKQISTLTKENKILLQQVGSDPFRTTSHDGTGNGNLLLSKHSPSSATCAKASEKVDKKQNNASVCETELGRADSTSRLETERNIDAWQLNFKYVFAAALALVAASLAAFLFQHQQSLPW